MNFCYDKKCTKCRNNEIGMCDRCEIGYRLSYGRCIEKCQDPNCLNCDYTLKTGDEYIVDCKLLKKINKKTWETIV